MTKIVLRAIAISLLCLAALYVSGCVSKPPENVENICYIFRKYPDWYWATQDVHRKWGVPINVQMAIVHQESRFRGDAKPPRDKILWVIPWLRPTSAYGYSQALQETWQGYKKDAGSHFARRSSFADAVDFIGWYTYRAHERLGLPRNNAYLVYLAYHEGMGGFERLTYLEKPWLIKVAKKVQRRAWIYKTQLIRCQHSLPQRPWWHVW